MFQFEVNFGEWGKYISHANSDIEWRNYNTILRISWLCYSKWKAGDGVSAVEDSSATICLGTRKKEIHLLVHSLVFSIAKSSSEAVC